MCWCKQVTKSFSSLLFWPSCSVVYAYLLPWLRRSLLLKVADLQRSRITMTKGDEGTADDMDDDMNMMTPKQAVVRQWC